MQSTNAVIDVFAELERGVHSALETYANVHRGSGYNSIITTQLYEQARDIVLEHLALPKKDYFIVFTSASGAAFLTKQLAKEHWRSITSADIGLALGIHALAITKNKINQLRFRAGGGTARLVAPHWVVWARGSDRFEAGTPPAINVFCFVRALKLCAAYGSRAFQTNEKTASAQTLPLDGLEQLSGRELLLALREQLIGKKLSVPTKRGTRRFINLDNSASTRTFQPVFKTFMHTLTVNRDEQKKAVEESRQICSDYFGAPASEYTSLFTSNTTEAIHIVAENLALSSGQGYEPVVVNSFLEHNSNELLWRNLPACSIARMRLNEDGIPDGNDIETLLRSYNHEKQFGNKRVQLVTVTACSNVLGVFHDLQKLSTIAHKYGAQLLVDAAQLAAHKSVDMLACGIDYLVFSAHKTYAPFGSGMLFARKGLLAYNENELALIKSSGEENAAGIAALGKALQLLKRIGLELIHEDEQKLTQQLLAALREMPKIQVFGPGDKASPEFTKKSGVVAFAMRGLMSDRVGNYLAENSGIGIRTGCHCAHILIKDLLKIPPMLQKFQKIIVQVFPKIELPGVARVSFGIENTPEDVAVLIQTLQELTEGTKRRAKQTDAAYKQSMELAVKEKRGTVFMILGNETLN